MQDGEAEVLRRQLEALERRLAALEAERQGAPTAPPPERARRGPRRDLEAHLGTYWLSRAGIVALITGLALLVVYRFEALGPLLRVGLGYALALALGGLGRWVSRRQRVLGQLLFSGGLALGYFVTYALHFVPAMRLVGSEALALVLLALYVVAIIAVAQRLHSETVAGISLFLGLHLGMLSDVTAFTLMATSLLAAGALFFLVKNRWVLVPLSSLVAVYSTHLLWASRAGHGQLALSLGFLALYFTLFTLAPLVRPDALGPRLAPLFAGGNAAALLALGYWEVARQSAPERFTFLLAVAAVLALAGGAARARRCPTPLVQAHLAFAWGALGLALPLKLEDGGLVLGWTVAALGAALVARLWGAGALAALAEVLLAGALGRAWWGAAPPGPVVLFVAAACVGVERLHAWRGVPGTPRAPWLLAGRWPRLGLAIAAGLALVRLAGEVLPSNLTTLAWVAAATLLFVLGFLLAEARYRWAALAWVGLALGRVVLVDLARASMDVRILTCVLLGVGLLAVSWVYTRWRGGRGHAEQTPPGV